MKRTLSILILLFAMTSVALTQHDTIMSSGGDMLVGEIKSMSKGVLIVKTQYSDKDFHIEWDEIKEVKSQNTFLIYLSDGRRMNGSVNSQSGDPGFVLINTLSGNMIIDNLLQITYLKPVEASFLGRLDASIELGYSFTKAKNHHQFNFNSNIGYLADSWGADASLDAIRSSQDSVADTRRTEGSIGYRKFLNNSWFVALSNNFLQDDEQKLRLRSITNLQAGHMFVNSYRTYWAVGVGAAFNYESFTTDQADDQSLEGLITTELNMFAFEDISVLTSLKIYPSVTVKGRVRADYKFDLKYDLPLDFFIKFGVSYNFDNKPVENAPKHNYVIQTTFGWEL